MAAKSRAQEQRERRNTLIMQFFFAGWSEREIARHHSIGGITPGRVHQIIDEEMKKLAGRHDLLSDQALPMYIERLETLIKATWPKAVSGDLKAVEVARRLLEQQARLWNLEEEGKLPAVPPMSDQEFDDDDSADQLARYRAKRQRRISGG